MLNQYLLQVRIPRTFSQTPNPRARGRKIRSSHEVVTKQLVSIKQRGRRIRHGGTPNEVLKVSDSQCTTTCRHREGGTVISYCSGSERLGLRHKLLQFIDCNRITENMATGEPPRIVSVEPPQQRVPMLFNQDASHHCALFRDLLKQRPKESKIAISSDMTNHQRVPHQEVLLMRGLLTQLFQLKTKFVICPQFTLAQQKVSADFFGDLDSKQFVKVS